LTQNVYKFALEEGIDPYSIIPKTFFVPEDSAEKTLNAVLEEIEESWGGFDNPCILKPGEFSNRGKGISMGYGKEDVRAKVLDLSENR